MIPSDISYPMLRDRLDHRKLRTDWSAMVLCVLFAASLGGCRSGAQSTGSNASSAVVRDTVQDSAQSLDPPPLTANVADSILSEAFGRLNGERFENCDSTQALQAIVAKVLSEPSSMSWKLPLTLHGYWGPWIVQSDDGRVRILNWLWACTGTWRTYPFVATVSNRQGEYGVHKSAGDFGDSVGFPSTGFQSIYHLRDSLYLALTSGQFSSGSIFEMAGVATISPTTMSWRHLPFEARDTTVDMIALDKYWYFQHLESFGYGIPTIIEYDTATRVLTFPTVKISGVRALSEVCGVGCDVQVDTTKMVRFRFQDSAFVEI